MKLKETSANGRKKGSHKKLGSQFGNVVVKTIVKYNEEHKIYQSSSLQIKTNNCDKNDIIYSTECWFININFFFFVLFFFCFLFSFSSFTYLYHIYFLSLGHAKTWEHMFAENNNEPKKEWASNYEDVEENQTLFGFVYMAFREVEAFAS